MNKILNFKNELYRKLIHLISLFIPIIYLWTSYYQFNLILLTITLIIIIIDTNKQRNNYLSKMFKNIFSSVIRKYEKNALLSASYMLIGFLIISVLISNKYIVVASMFITAISDSIAAVIGIKYGRIKLINNKTLEGSLGFFISTIIIISLFNLLNSVLLLFIYCLLITLTELLTISEYDNLTIPLSSGLILFFIV
tara:strand:- start:306 stop:893 length:588 start_codon:yes stop_codon:yes gene_type:complete